MNGTIKHYMYGSLLAGVVLLSGCSAMKVMIERPFGSSKDVSDASTLWNKLEKKGYINAQSTLYEGSMPHGSIQEVLEGTVDGKVVVVKRNYRGKNLTIDDVKANRAKYLKAITVMEKRENGYDSENKDWFYAKYNPDGSLAKKMGMIPLAGRVGKGVDGMTCISCHSTAPDGEYRFIKDDDPRLKHL